MDFLFVLLSVPGLQVSVASAPLALIVVSDHRVMFVICASLVRAQVYEHLVSPEACAPQEAVEVFEAFGPLAPVEAFGPLAPVETFVHLALPEMPVSPISVHQTLVETCKLPVSVV
jgi:hypothetical protein